MRNLILLFAVVPMFVFGQKVDSLKHMIGVQAGYSYNIPTIKGGRGLLGRYLPGHNFVAGGHYRIYPKKWLYLSAGLQLERVSFGRTGSVVWNEHHMSYSLVPTDSLFDNYLSYFQIGLPIMLGFNPGKKVFGILAIGIIPGITFGSKNEIGFYDYGQNPLGNIVYKDGYSGQITVYFIAELGIGFQITKNITLCISAKYSGTPKNGRYQAPQIINDELSTTWISFQGRDIKAEFGLYFNLKKKPKKEKPIEEIETQ